MLVVQFSVFSFQFSVFSFQFRVSFPQSPPLGWAVKKMQRCKKIFVPVLYPVRDLILVEIDVSAKSGVPLGTQYFFVYHVPNGTSEGIGDTFFYQYHVPNGTFRA